MIQGAICLLAAVPATLVHALDFFISPARSLVLLRAWNWDEGINGGERVSSLYTLLAGIIVETCAMTVDYEKGVAGVALRV
jgi:hypothetical protein